MPRLRSASFMIRPLLSAWPRTPVDGVSDGHTTALRTIGMQLLDIALSFSSPVVQLISHFTVDE
jgi:hypothetical protein